MHGLRVHGTTIQHGRTSDLKSVHGRLTGDLWCHKNIVSFMVTPHVVMNESGKLIAHP
jgi:hypothetical protein